MNIFLGLLGILLSWIIIRYREAIGNTLGEAAWMRSIGGIYYVIIFTAIFIFLWSLLMMFGLTNQVVEPIVRIFMPVEQGGVNPFQSL
ncbi:MAG: hypothetical protein WCX61_02135 [Candidatus Peribacteraceae bacterium]|jgi:hypothetical protein